MGDEIDTMLVQVRADTQGFARDVDAKRASLEGPLEAGADRAGKAIEATLLRAVRTGKLGFDDLKSVALSAMDAIAKSALDKGIGAITGESSGGLGGALTSLLAGLFGGSPGRATGGPVSPARPYWVGERGPELFVPASAGQVMPASGSAGGRDVRVAITVNAGAGDTPRALAQSSRQVARAVKEALAGVG